MEPSEVSKEQLGELWKSGVPLDDAWVEFAVHFDRYALQALRTQPANDPDVLKLDHPRYIQLNAGWLPKTWEGRQKKLQIVTKNERGNLLGELYAGRLWAIGYQTLANGFDEPVRVPRQLFLEVTRQAEQLPLNVDWTRAEVRDGAVSYFDIHVVRPPVVVRDIAVPVLPDQKRSPSIVKPSPSDAPNAERVSSVRRPELVPRESKIASPIDASPAPKLGRPNTYDEIRGKVDELWNGGPLFRAIPNRIDQAREVRARLKGESARHLDDMPGYRSGTIQRIIGEVANTRDQPERSE